MTRPAGARRQTRKMWTPEEDGTMRREFPTRPSKEVAELLGRGIFSILGRASKLGLRKDPEYLRGCLAECRRRTSTHPSSIAGRFPKGHVPANKGLRRPGYPPGRMRETQFKKGHHNEHGFRPWVPIGSLRVNADKYLERKVREEGRGAQRWRAEHSLIWERQHGPVPPGHIVVFKDRDRRHVDLKNLECITLAENMRRNTIHRRRPPELKKAIYAMIQVKRITMREKKNGQKQTERPAGPPV
jgi:hypothetical protein